jgi:hypothetical protein
VDVLDCIAQRYSARGYRPDPVDDEKLGKVLPATKVARYLQLETKIRSVIKFEMAQQIPLVY